MTNTTREEEARRNESTMWIGIIASIVFSVAIMSVIMVFYLENRLQDVPVKICHNETVWCNLNITSNICYSSNKSFTQEIEAMNYSSYIDINDNYKIYLNIGTKEVCEIK